MKHAGRSLRGAVALALASAMTGSCSSSSVAADATPPADDRVPVLVDGAPRAPVVLVTLDGARWQEIFGGTEAGRVGPEEARTAAELMPTLHRMSLEEGAFIGADVSAAIHASGPNFVSLPGYLELLSGQVPRACKTNDCPQTGVATLLDDAASAGLTVAAFSSWERISLAATASPGAFLVSAGRPDGDPGPAAPGHDGYRPDAKTASAALAYLERAQPDLLFVGLGDTDEYAHQGNYRAYLGALSFADDFLRRLRDLLDAMGDRGRATHVFVTADHGRAEDFTSHGAAPESSRVWLAASGPTVRARGLATSPHDRHLRDVAPTLARVLGLDRGLVADAIDELF